MKMSKNQIVMASIGGVAFVVSAAVGYLAFDAYSAKGEAHEECEGASSAIQRMLRADVSPDKESELAYRRNRDTLSGWSEAALAAASAGDRAISSDVNEAAFKQRLVDEARALSELEGGVNGKIVKSDFTFGFPDFVTGDKLPEKARLPQLQRQWGDIKTLVETLQSCGVEEIVAISAAAPLAKPKAEEDPRQAKKNRKKKNKAAADEKPMYTVETYAVDFRAKPAALVKAVNALATSVRFVVVDSMSFAREGDMIAAAISDDPKASAGQQQHSPRRGRRRRGQPEPDEAAKSGSDEDQAKKSGIVADPAKEAPFLVKMSVSTYDFGSAEKAAAQTADEGGSEKKEEGK